MKCRMQETGIFLRKCRMQVSGKFPRKCRMRETGIFPLGSAGCEKQEYFL